MKFDDIGMTTEECFEALVKKEVITPVTNYVTRPDADMTKYCKFHQGHGHVTNNCFTLKRIIQGLVDDKKLIPIKKPNTVSNPLPGNTVNMIEFGGYINMLEFGEPVPTAKVTRSRKRKAEFLMKAPPTVRDSTK